MKDRSSGGSEPPGMLPLPLEIQPRSLDRPAPPAGQTVQEGRLPVQEASAPLAGAPVAAGTAWQDRTGATG